MKRKYYSLENILKTDSEYYILLGQRANGKSYAVKEHVLKNAYENKEHFVYLRRYREDIKTQLVESYFMDMNVEKITNGTYSIIIAYQSYIYFGNIDEAGKTVRGEKIGRYCALSEAIRYKSNAFVDYTSIVYEEFITDEVYLADEPSKLQQFISTVARDKKLAVFLVGNTMSRVCPYFSEWALKGTLQQKAGTIEIYHQHYTENGEEKTVNIAVERCESVNTGASMFFGNASKQIISGEWDVKEAPKLPRKQKDYEEHYRIYIRFNEFLFCIKLLSDDRGSNLLFILPAKDVKKNSRVLDNTFQNDIYTTTALNPHSRVEMRIKELFMQGKACYSDNLTAADFQNVRAQYKFF